MTENGAGNEPKAVLFVSKKDGSILKRFPSITKAAEYLETTDRSRIQRQNKDRALSAFDYMVRFESEWSGYERFKPNAYNRPIIAVSGNDLMWYRNATEAGKRLGFPGIMVSHYAKHEKLLPSGIFVKYQEDTKEFAEMRELMNKKKELECLSTK